MVPPIGAICGVKTNDLRILVASLAKSDCLLQILPLSDIVTTNKVDPKEKKTTPIDTTTRNYYLQLHLVS